MKLSLLKLIVCPICNGNLKFNFSKKELICEFDLIAYPLKKNIPILLKDEARYLHKD